MPDGSGRIEQEFNEVQQIALTSRRKSWTILCRAGRAAAWLTGAPKIVNRARRFRSL